MKVKPIALIITLPLKITSFEHQSCSLSENNTMSSSSSSIRKNILGIYKILPTPSSHWVGDGFNVYPVFGPSAFDAEVSPWLMFDYAAPKKFPATKRRLGVGKHPHRGFETITIAFQGSVEHSDSVGNNDIVGPGDVQWMTAGRGIIHEEFHSTDFSKRGGIFEMCQIWLNLPSQDKMVPPAYQPILSNDIPLVSLDDNGYAKARVIAGTLNGVKGPATTHSPVELWDVTIQTKGTTTELPIPAGHNVVVFIRRGAAEIGNNSSGGKGSQLGPQGVALLRSEADDEEGTLLVLTALDDNTAIMILGGAPIHEPIAARGPFVMNTFDELAQANRDFRNGKMGR